MPQQSDPLRWTVRIAYASMIAGLVFLALLLGGLAALTIANLSETWSWDLLLRRVLMGLGILAGALVLVSAYGMIRLLHATEDGAARSASRLYRIETLAQNQGTILRELSRLTSLSDQTKGLIFHDREVEAIRDTFHDALVRQEYGSAEELLQALEQRPGYQAVVARLRQEIEDSRKATEQEKLDTPLARIDRMIERKDWQRAHAATQRMLEMFPDHPKVTPLPERIQAAKTRHKRELLQAYGAAVRKNDVDLGIELLKELDQYLEPQEAAALEESARGVFRARLHNLGVQFALCVTDEQWTQAVAVGEQIMRQYPNTRMSSEVKEKMDQLRTLAFAKAQAPRP